MIKYDRENHKLFGDIKGTAVIIVNGKTTLISKDGVDIDGGSADLSGVVTQNCICPFTGNPHSDFSANVKISKG